VKRDFSRRGFLRAGSSAAAVAAAGAQTPRRDNPIVAENRKPGTTHWQLQYTQFEYPAALQAMPLIRGLRSIAVEGFASRASAAAGESIEFKISTSAAANVLIDIYRMGYYGGKGGRHVLRLGSFKAQPQPMPPMTIERLRECAWETTAKLTIPKDWVSGVYLAKITREEPFGKQSYIILVVKDHRHTDLLFQVSDLTWQAYNKWPTRDSLYDDGGPDVWTSSTHVRVSFDRPYAKYCQIVDAPQTAGSGEFLLWEFPFCYWMEREGYDATYCSNLDLHFDPKILTSCRAFLSIAHDEYWSREMYNHVMDARERGVSLGFFSGNALCWEVEMYRSSIDGAPGRAYRRRRLFPDEPQLMGTKSYGSGYGDWVVSKPNHWIYEKTGLAAGDAIPGLIGWEYHGTPASLPGLEVVAEAPLFPVRGWDGDRITTVRDHPQRHAAVVFPGPKGNWVFNAGTIWWPEGLSQPPGHIPARHSIAGTMGPDERVKRITRNVLDRFIRDSKRG
jgi:hypothetical protein